MTPTTSAAVNRNKSQRDLLKSNWAFESATYQSLLGPIGTLEIDRSSPLRASLAFAKTSHLPTFSTSSPLGLAWTLESAAQAHSASLGRLTSTTLAPLASLERLKLTARDRFGFAGALEWAARSRFSLAGALELAARARFASLGRSIWPRDLAQSYWGARINRSNLLSHAGALKVTSRSRFGIAWAFETAAGT